MDRILLTATAALILGTTARVEAQLPTVQQVYDRFAEAVGGVTAWKPVNGRTETGTANITFAGIIGSYERFMALPNKNRLIIDLGVVRIDQGFDGEKGWVDQGQGPQPMPPEMMQNMAEVIPDGAHFLSPAQHVSANVTGKETFEGVEVYAMATTSKTGEQAIEYFEVASGLRLGRVTTAPGGDQTVIFKDYKAFEGKQVPTTIIQRNGQGDIVLTLTSLTFGAPAAGAFTAPD
jgi:hypothetical protein